MGVTKWIFTGLGWVTLGPIGALLGYFVGSTIEGRTQGIPRFNNRLGDSNYTMGSDGKPHRRFHNTGTQDDIDVALLVLIASVMKADGTVHRSELDYVKRFLAKNYGEEKGKVLLGMLRDLVKPETYIDIDAVCLQIKQNTDYTTRYHMVDFLFGLSVTDNSYTTTTSPCSPATSAPKPATVAVRTAGDTPTAATQAPPPLAPPPIPTKCWDSTAPPPTRR